MNNVQVETQKQSKNNWKSFFELKMFRYALLKQAKSISTYILVVIVIILNMLLLKLATIMANDPRAKVEEINKIEFITNNYNAFVLWFYGLIFTLFIGFKILQMFRDEMDDGTLLVFSSMPYSRFKLIFQRWLSLHIVCLVFSLLTIYVPPSLYVIFAGFSDESKEILKLLCKDSLMPILASIVFQTLILTIAILISLYLGKTGTISCLSLIGSISMVASFIPGILEFKSGSNANHISKQMKNIAQLKDKLNLNKYLNDPEMKQFFELETWYTDEQIVNKQINSYNESPLEFDDNYIAKLYNAYSQIKSDPSKFASFLNKNFKLKYSNKTINVYPIKVKSKGSLEIDKNDSNYNKIKSFDESNNHSEKEKKIIQLSNAIFDYQNQQQSEKQPDLLLINASSNSLWILNQMWEQLSSKYGIEKQEMLNTILRIINNNKLVYVIEDIELGYKPYLYAFIKEKIIDRTVFLKIADNLDEVLKAVESSRKRNKINNYLNIMTQMQILWVKNAKYDRNLDGKLEIKEKRFKPAYGREQKVKYLELKPDSVKFLVRPMWLYIIYTSISIVLSAATVCIIYRRDFV